MSPSNPDDEWTQLILPDSGRKYFYNVITGESRWDIRNQGGPYNAKHHGGPRFMSNTRPMHPSMSNQSNNSGPYYVSNKKPMHPMANGTRPNRNYHSLNDAFDYSNHSHRHQQRVRPQHYEFMTPPRERRQSIELGFPGQSRSSQVILQPPQPHQSQSVGSDPFQRQRSQVILKPPHQSDPVTRNHRKSHSYSNISDKSAESIKQEFIDAYHKRSTDSWPSISIVSDQRKNRTNNATVESHVVNLLQSMEMEKPNNYNKDYVGLSKAYKLMENYRLNQDKRPVCVCCNNGKRLDKVLFPCEHVCICSHCLETALPKRCPLCKDIIRRVLDCNGHEQEDYWKWVEEVKPAISTKFLQQFFAESKNAIKHEMGRHRSPGKIADFHFIAEEKLPKPQMQQHHSGSIFSCWQRLLGRRASCAPEKVDRPQSYSYL